MTFNKHAAVSQSRVHFENGECYEAMNYKQLLTGTSI
jgi:hypothetical protein